jgi:hypothetical protein
MIIPMKYKLGDLLLGELTNGMFISVSGFPFYKNTLTFNSEETLEPYEGNESVEITNTRFNELTRDYFSTIRKPNDKAF